ncbi:MAG: methyl-accepting chemotaxis protein, partial [Sulfuricellaceae bacterium]|nr:methyl-accepting chemotaxis protein [Sulfuricellaceae bacterium]
MKTNLPVTTLEHQLKPGQPIVTKTDTKGIVTYVNQAFIDISGFDRDELIGKSHNLVRHPDMPPEAFADLWDTVKQEQPWRGIVKNRCKNGDFYWVEAYVTPIKENGRTVGYMSVRGVPAAGQVAAAEKLYREVKTGAAKIPRTLSHKNFLPSIVNQIGFSFAILALLLIATGLVGMRRGDIELPLSLSLFGVTFALLAGFWLRQALGSGISRAIHALDQLAEGNFNARVDVAATGELSRLLTALESMRINTRAIIADVMHSARTLEEVAQWLKKEMHQVNERSVTQSGRANASSQELQGMFEFIQSLTGNTHETAVAATQTRGLVDTGNQYMASGRI